MVNHYTELPAAFEAVPVEQLASFFHDNAEQIDTLIKLYEAYNKHVMNAQARHIYELKNSIRNQTADERWSDIEGLDLVYDHFDPQIAIRGGFSSTPGEPLGSFSIHLVTPNIQAWNYYEDQLLNHYVGQEPVILGNKTVLPVVTLPGKAQDQILAALQEVYTFVSHLSVQTFLHSLTSH